MSSDLRRLVRYFRPYRLSLIGGVACILGYVAFNVTVPLIVGRAIDQNWTVVTWGKLTLAALKILYAKVKARRHNPDHRAPFIVEDQSLPDDVRPGAKFALPQRLGDHHSGVRAQAVFVRAESPAHERVDAENFEESRGNHLSMQAFRLAITGKIEAGHAKTSPR